MIAAFTEAIRLDPHYALAFAGRSLAFSAAAEEADTVAAVREGFDEAQADARQALERSHQIWPRPTLQLRSFWNTEPSTSRRRVKRTSALLAARASGKAEILRLSSQFAAWMGHFDAALAAARRAVVLDPLARESHTVLGRALYAARRYEDAVAAWAEVISLAPDFKGSYAERGLSFYVLGNFERARTSCETNPDYWYNQQCLALIYDKLGRHADAEAVLSKLKANGDAAAYQYATVYAQWGNHAKALEWLETALRLRDPGLVQLKTDPLMDPLRQEPPFQAIERELKFPN